MREQTKVRDIIVSMHAMLSSIVDNIACIKVLL